MYFLTILINTSPFIYFEKVVQISQSESFCTILDDMCRLNSVKGKKKTFNSVKGVLVYQC